MDLDIETTTSSSLASPTKTKSRKGIESYNHVLKNDIENLKKSLIDDLNGGITYKDDKSGDTALHKAAFLGYYECVDILIKNGAIVDEENNNKSTPLIKASFAGHAKCIELLLKAGADINKCNDAQDTALIGASWIGADDCINLLLKHGAKKDIKDSLGQDYIAIQKQKKEEFKANVLTKARALGLSDVLYAQFQSIKIEDMEAHFKELKSSKKNLNSRKETIEQIEQAIISWKDNFLKLHLETFLDKNYKSKSMKEKVIQFSRENESFSRTADTKNIEFLDKVDIFKRYHVDTLYDKSTREELQKIKLLIILQERKDLLTKELNAILNKLGITISYYAIYANIKIDDITTYVEQLKKDNDFQNAMTYKKILDDFVNQYKIYELEYACPDVLRELNLFQKREYFIKELQKYHNTITDSKMNKNCKTFLLEVERMPLLSLDNVTSPSKVNVNFNNNDTKTDNIVANDEINTVPTVISPTPPSSQPPSFVSPKKQAQNKTSSNDTDDILVVPEEVTSTTEEIDNNNHNHNNDNNGDDLIENFEELGDDENAKYVDDFVGEIGGDLEEDELREPEEAS